jgi:hypothetical protein
VQNRAVSSWWIWPIGVVVLLAVGFGTTLMPRRRVAEQTRRTAWSTARAAIDAAGVSRDAAPARVAEAEQLLSQAESIAARHGGRSAAETAADCARRADRMWRAVGGE